MMIINRALPLIVFIVLLLIAQVFIWAKDEQKDIDEVYPEDIDLLEEIIQSYYLLLDTEDLINQYPMLKKEDNVIGNEAVALQSFYTKLAELRNGKRERVSILQIGDSHIQPGYFSGTARASLQRYFGNAGRGLVFPWKLARTNQPDDIRITSNSVWKRSSEEIGICGYGLSTKAAGNLIIQTNNFFKTDNNFNSITLLLKEQDNSFDWKIAGETKDVTFNTASFAEASVYQLHWTEPVNKIELIYKAEKAADQAYLYGLILEKQQAGLLYHAIGINGATFDKFSKIPEFFPQINLLNPDLIVVSLGTNDVQGRFRADVYLKTIRQFMTQLTKYNNNVPVLFTLPPDSFKRNSINVDLKDANQILMDYATKNGYAYWNLQQVMGGEGAIRQWRNLGLARSDYKHFTPKGYMLMGQLFYQALIKGYKAYAEQR